ncbi:VOC family protein [Thermopolyspora sp. NPDC052614]|uniref:VOC family protein n=1 Tax=Thermopolyspora sp. NPDC052614 TaxID=3155682 RepID=UPI0034330546
MTHTTDTSPRTAIGNPSVWPCLAYRDAPAAITFLVEAFGFIERARYGDAGLIQHAQLAWPNGPGGVMLGSVRENHEFSQSAGTNVVYVVTEEPDVLFARATAAGAEVVRGLTDEDYGSRGFTVRDPEGNLWSFGTYRGE